MFSIASHAIQTPLSTSWSPLITERVEANFSSKGVGEIPVTLWWPWPRRVFPGPELRFSDNDCQSRPNLFYAEGRRKLTTRDSLRCKVRRAPEELAVFLVTHISFQKTPEIVSDLNSPTSILFFVLLSISFHLLNVQYFRL